MRDDAKPAYFQHAQDDDRVRKVLLSLLAVLPMIIWIVYIVAAGLADHGPDNPAQVNEKLKFVGVASGTAIAVVAGSFLGISNALGQQDIGGLDGRGTGWWSRVRAGMRVPRLTVNAIAALIYFLGLLLALVFWLLDSNKDTSEEVISSALATLAGFALGAFKAATDKR